MDSEDVGRRRRRIVVPGPFAPFADGLREDLAGQGFSPDTIADHVHRLRTQRTTEKWLLAIDGSAPMASAYIIAGDSVMSIGGFTGTDPTMTTAKLAELVRGGRLRFVSIAGASEEQDPGSDSGSGSQGTDQSSGGSRSPDDSGPGGPGGPGGNGSIISSTAAAVCKNVPSSTWGGTGASTLYGCAGKADAIAAAAATVPTPPPTSSTGN